MTEERPWSWGQSFYEHVMITFISKKDATYMTSSEFFLEVFRHILHVIRGASVARDGRFLP
jgi:hypothetical protein